MIFDTKNFYSSISNKLLDDSIIFTRGTYKLKEKISILSNTPENHNFITKKFRGEGRASAFLMQQLEVTM